jgi:cysteine-rich repeat protein
MRRIAIAWIAGLAACGDDGATSPSSSSSSEMTSSTDDDITPASTSMDPDATTGTVADTSESSVTSADTTTAEGTSSSSSSGDTSSSESTSSSSTANNESSSDTSSSSSTGAVEPECGNGSLEMGEVCDDNNLIGGDGCEADCTSSDDVLPLWELEMGGPDGFADCGGGVAFDSAGNLVLAGLWADQIWIGKFDTGYAPLWEATYPAVSGTGACLEVRVAVDADDNVGVIGPQDSDTIYDVFVALLDADGAEQWTATFAGASAQTDNAGDIAFDPEGNVLVTGDLTDVNENRTFWVAKLDPDGAPLWADEYLGEGCCINGGRGIASDADGSAWSVGYESPQLYETDIFMRRYDPDGGIISTEAILGVDASSQDIAYDVALDELGDRIVVGTYRVDADVDDNDAWVRRYDDGMELWMTPFEGTGPAEDLALGVALAPDGTIVTSGVMFDSAADGDRNRWLAKLSSDGVPIWQRRVDESATDFWVSVAVASDGRIAVAGLSGFAFPWLAEARYAVYPP